MAEKKKSNAEPEEEFNPKDFILHGPQDRVVSKIVNGEKVFNVFSGKTLENLSIKEKLIDGLWTIEDEKTKEVREFMLAKIEEERVEKESKLSLQVSQTPAAPVA